ncbi:MAG: nucleoside deaminase [Arenicellales bacterium]|nr:nucleoside deaminase [Arenicellales bacterium]
MDHQRFLDIACDEAQQSIMNGGIGAGAVMVKNEGVIAKSHDRTKQINDPIAVAEVDCIRKAGRRNDQTELILYTTRYPDMLCVGTILQFSIGAVVIGLEQSDTPELTLLKNKGVPVTFSPHAQCKKLMQV